MSSNFNGALPPGTQGPPAPGFFQDPQAFEKIGMGFKALQAGAGSISTFNQAKQAKNLSEFQVQLAQKNQQLLELQIQDTKERGKDQEDSTRRKLRKIIGHQKAAGVDPDLISDANIIGLFDNRQIKRNTSRELFSKEVQLINSPTNESFYKNQSNSNSPGLAASSSLLSSAVPLSNRYFRSKK